MKENNLTLAWTQYECGKDFKRKTGLYTRVDENERFFRGDQWRGASVGNLPTPIFNVVRRIVNYLVSTVLSYDIGVKYQDIGLSCQPIGAYSKKRENELKKLNRVVKTMWSQCDMDSVLRKTMYDAALSGDGVVYCYYDPFKSTLGHLDGDIVTKNIDNVNVFANDMNCADIQSQEYIIISGRCSLEKLKAEAKSYGANRDILSKIVADDDAQDFAGDFSSVENEDIEAKKATYLIKFSRDDDGYVVWEKFTKYVKISSAKTKMRRYPIAYFSFTDVKGSFHGETPISELIHNQKYINKAYALAMKHMVDTAFSKVIYDKRLIPEWDNEVGQAVGVMSGGDVSCAATVLGVGQMQEGYLELLESVISNTKEMSGATEVALGEVDPTNTSAILALIETAELSLDSVRAGICGCVKELAMIWLEMMIEYFGKERYIYVGENEPETAITVDFDKVCPESINASVDMGAARRFSKSVLISTLTDLLKNGHITFEEYLERLPDGVLEGKEALLERAKRGALGAGDKND